MEDGYRFSPGPLAAENAAIVSAKRIRPARAPRL